jgi:hypothetical protein
VDEMLMYYSWHLVMLESMIVAMLFGGVSQKLASYKLKFIFNYSLVPSKLQGSCTWGYHDDHAYGTTTSMPIIGICHIGCVHMRKDCAIHIIAFGCLSYILQS